MTDTTTDTGQQHAAARKAVAMHATQVSAIEGQLADLKAREAAAETRLSAAQRTERAAAQALQQVQKAQRAAQARALIAATAGAKAGDAGATQANAADLEAATAAVSAAETALAGALSQVATIAAEVQAERQAVAAERAQLQAQHEGAAALHAELERQRDAAKAALGREELARISEEYVAAASTLATAYAQLEAARKAVIALDEGLEQRLADWPELRSQVSAYAPLDALTSFDVLQAWCAFLEAHIYGAGRMAPVPQSAESHVRVPMQNIIGVVGHVMEHALRTTLVPGASWAGGAQRDLEIRRRELAKWVAGAAAATQPTALRTLVSAPSGAGNEGGDAA